MINENYFLLNVALITLGTITIRGCFIAVSGKMSISPQVKELFTYIPASILPALVVPVTFFYQGQVAWIGGKERFLVLIAACIFCYFVRKTLYVITFGLVLLYLVSHVN